MSDAAVAFTVGDVIRKLRKDKRWSIRKLAVESGIGRMTISAIERNESNYQKETLEALAKAFHKTAPELEALVTPGPKLVRRASDVELPPEWIAFTRRMMRLTRQAQGVILMMLAILEDLGAAGPFDPSDHPTPTGPADQSTSA
jgi:transcriptional regulator with XRE-family HTH domain